MSDLNRGDDWYNRQGNEYEFADEVGWIRVSDGTVVEAHEGYGGRREREANREERRFDRSFERRGW